MHLSSDFKFSKRLLDEEKKSCQTHLKKLFCVCSIVDDVADVVNDVADDADDSVDADDAGCVLALKVASNGH